MSAHVWSYRRHARVCSVPAAADVRRPERVPPGPQARPLSRVFCPGPWTCCSTPCLRGCMAGWTCSRGASQTCVWCCRSRRRPPADSVGRSSDWGPSRSCPQAQIWAPPGRASPHHLVSWRGRQRDRSLASSISGLRFHRFHIFTVGSVRWAAKIYDNCIHW